MGTAPYVRFVAKSGSGKTTFLEKLIPVLQSRGYRVGTIKHHSHPEFEIDQPGKDTWRHYEAGADAVIIASPIKMATVRRLEKTPDLADLAVSIPDVDIILVEGFGRDTTSPKIEVLRAARSSAPLNKPAEVLAYVTDIVLEGALCYSLDDAEGVADLLERSVLHAE
jgi:molybdopterin-guanine dinucleotide biosynthesis protein MobB